MPSFDKAESGAASIDIRDEDSPDSWVDRDPELIRLTGKHPLNAEPPLEQITISFISEPSKSYVRNHGAVLRASWENFQVTVSGKGLKREWILTMQEISALPSLSVAVTFSCSGNRRQEVNFVKPSIGVSYGSGAVMTAVWTGVRLSTVFDYCGFQREDAIKGQAQFINVYSPDEELPKGSYGTSLLLPYALDPANDVILAYLQNQEPMKPDHGYPLRLIIPGYIGGRNIKYASRLEVSDEECSSHYYFHDNRLLPPEWKYWECYACNLENICRQRTDALGTCMLTKVDSEKAREEKWWHNPEYIIGEMNINSAITSPGNGEILNLSSSNKVSTTISGYAYSGGGRRVVIVELTLDDGKTWRMATFNDSEYNRPNDYGKFWCWRLWSVQVEIADLVGSKSIHVRAWDTSFNTQPRDITWNILGMMNNSWYHVAVSPCRDVDGSLGLCFVHPEPEETPLPMRDKERGRPPCESGEDSLHDLPKEGQRVSKEGTKVFTSEEVQEHNRTGDTWLTIEGKVYDVSSFMKDHPGGEGIIAMNAGQICDEFRGIHSKDAWKLLEKFYIGECRDHEDLEREKMVGGEKKLDEEDKVALGPHAMLKCKLIQKEVLTHNTRRFRFALPSEKHRLGLPIGQHIYIHAQIHGALVIRPYTPITLDQDTRGYFDLLIKIYRAHENPKFPEGGKMTQYLDALEVGEDTVDVKGPAGDVIYKGKGVVMYKGKETKPAKRIGLISGGTGLTPIYQIIQAAIKDPEDKTELRLLFANKTPEDIFMRGELESIVRDSHGQLDVWHTVDQLPLESLEHGVKWPYSVGHVSFDMLNEHLVGPPSGEGEDLVLMCGPPPMIQYACLPNLERLGYTEAKDMFQF